jgi:D-glycero-alpha-D-manno-heptose-7-phosphate kinase
VILVRAPLRITFAGGGTDLPFYFGEHPGCSVNMAIETFVWIAINRKFDDRLRVSYSRTEDVAEPAALQHELVRLSLLRFGIFGGIEIASIGDVPGEGSGLGSSSAFTVALLLGLSVFDGFAPSAAPALARMAYEIESQGAGRAVGKQDQLAAAHGGLRCYRFVDDKAMVSTPLGDTEKLWELEQCLLLFYTGQLRAADAILRAAAAAAPSSKVRMTALHEARLDAEVLALALARNEWGQVGESIRLGWELKRRWAPEGVTPELVEMVDRGIAAGATAGKIVGAGGGGFVLFYVATPGAAAAVREAFEGLRELPVRCARSGAQVVYR